MKTLISILLFVFTSQLIFAQQEKTTTEPKLAVSETTSQKDDTLTNKADKHVQETPQLMTSDKKQYQNKKTAEPATPQLMNAGKKEDE